MYTYIKNLMKYEEKFEELSKKYSENFKKMIQF